MLPLGRNNCFIRIKSVDGDAAGDRITIIHCERKFYANPRRISRIKIPICVSYLQQKGLRNPMPCAVTAYLKIVINADAAEEAVNTEDTTTRRRMCCINQAPNI